MIKKQQKWIALFVTLTFLWLLQASTMPVAAASTSGQISSANAEQAPNFVEQEGDSGYQAKKKSIVPIILIGVGVIAVAAVLLLVVFKTKYDVRGTWAVTTTWSGSAPTHFTLIFAGTKESGTFREGNPNWKGTYTVDGKNAIWQYDATTHTMIFSGTFTDKDSMSGEMTDTNPTDSGTFTAVRTAAAAGIGTSGPGGTGKETK
jgi:hypothetical protein